MNRLDQRFKKLAADDSKAIVFFVTAGDPSLKVTREVLRYCDQNSVDCVEIGVPFSDPLADGPVIQASSYRALRRGVHIQQILYMVNKERLQGLTIPIVLMSSYNLIHHFGSKRFMQSAAKSGVDGLIIPDLPLHEASDLIRMSRQFGLNMILMETPTTPPNRKKLIRRASRGFIYCVSITGVTGKRRSNQTYIDRDQAARVSKISDGVIVGSALVNHLKQYSNVRLSQKTKQFMQGFIKAVKK